MGDKSNIEQPIKEIELKDINIWPINIWPINIWPINRLKKIEYNKEYEDIKGIIKKYVENKLKS